MVGRHHLLSVTAIVAALGSFLPACFSDLPAALTCPPPEKRVMGACDAALAASTAIECVEPSTHACLRGIGATCTCAADACPEDPIACFADECPEAVRVVAPDARCFRPAREKFVAGRADGGCGCGCLACARICDGEGPTIGTRIPGGAGDVPVPIVVNLDGSRLPEKGRLGVYVRIRGVGTVSLVFAREKQSLHEAPFVIANEPRFVERVFEAPRGWPGASEAPDKIGLVTQPGATLVEVDCLIPFTRP